VNKPRAGQLYCYEGYHGGIANGLVEGLAFS
jgi:hypothetical protein